MYTNSPSNGAIRNLNHEGLMMDTASFEDGSNRHNEDGSLNKSKQSISTDCQHMTADQDVTKQEHKEDDEPPYPYYAWCCFK